PPRPPPPPLLPYTTLFRSHDSLGYGQVIRPGQVNLMTAGRGIAHSEESLGSGTMHASQLWIALPESHRHCEPAFAHHPILPQTKDRKSTRLNSSHVKISYA